MNKEQGIMNKEQVIKKINKIGSTGAGFALAFKIILGILAGLTLIGAISLTCLPKNLLDVGVSTKANVNVDVEGFGQRFDDKAKEEIEINILNDNSGSFSFEGHEAEIESVEVGETTLGIITEPFEYHMTLRSIALVVWGGFFALVANFILMFFISNVCKAFKTCQSPFDAEVIDKMRKLAIALIPWAIFLGVAEGLIEGFATGLNNFSFSVDIGVIVVIVVIFALTTVFKYGAMLQQESDETL